MLHTIKSHQMVGANDMKPSSREGRKNNRGLLPKEQNHGLRRAWSIQIVHPCKAVEGDEAGIQTGCLREADRLTSRERNSPLNSPRNLPLNLQILPTQCLKDGIWGGAQRIERCWWCPSFFHSNDVSLFIRIMAPNLYGTGDWFHGRQFFHGLGKGLVSGWFKSIIFTMHLSSTIITSAPPQINRH